MEQLGRYKGRSAVLLTSAQGLELKGSFVRTRMFVNANYENRSFNSGDFSKEAQRSVYHSQEDQDVVLFMGSPKLEGFSELKVNHLAHDVHTIQHLMNPRMTCTNCGCWIGNEGSQHHGTGVMWSFT